MGEKARSMRTAMITTGTKRRSNGGGGSGGKTKGRSNIERVRNTITIIDLALKNLTIKLCNNCVYEWSSLDLIAAKD